MRNDLLIELWESRPKLVEKRNEETQEMVKEVLLDVNSNLPVIDQRIRGVRMDLILILIFFRS
jgi:hypothetical protein